ncbi:clavesin-2-like [Glossina fuscipes]|uniref:Clavesin-2-like n=1 Tax=Glossina fuscipes TaxID=7396 RepID=A0A9C6DZ61_9MUSC|nr:clavesin-2-like [Glossina fuscipes]XP_037897452.1 clavesin-2-like [Glossina fuscipes]KAI9576508.1 hypothetical protein GQX74_009565 [Glossina fuscipes]
MALTQYELNLEPQLPEEFKRIAAERGECEETKTQNIEEFRRYILEHNDCKPHRIDDEYLIKFLRARFWKISSSYRLICNYYKFREQNLSYYETVRPLDYKYIGDSDIISVTPYRDQYGHRILIYRFGNWKPDEISIDVLFRVSVILLELGSLEPISQVVGGVGIYDLQNLTLSQIVHLSPSYAQKIIALLVTSMPISTSALHIVNPNWTFKAAFKLFTPFLNAAMRERLFIHSDMESLHEHISPEHLPKRYGGFHEEHSPSRWFDNMRNNEKVQNELKQLGYIF